MAGRAVSRRFAVAAIAAALVAAALLVAAKIRAARLPAVDLPVVWWNAIADDIPDDPVAVSKNAFLDQVSDLWNGGFETPSPARLRAYADWGRPLPDAPCLLRFGTPLASLVEPDGVEAILAGAGFTAFVDLPCEDVENGKKDIHGPLLDWDAIRAAVKRGTLRFAPCVSMRPGATMSLERALALYRERVGRRADAAVVWPESARKFGRPVGPRDEEAAAALPLAFFSATGVASWGPGPDPGQHALPMIPVFGGRQAFALELRQDAVDPAFFGTLAVSHPSGGRSLARPLSLFVWQKDDPEPIVDEPLALADADGRLRTLEPDETFEAPVPAAPAFPLEVRVYDETGTVLYFRRELHRNEVKRDPSWRPPVLDPDERLEIEPL